MKTKKTETKKIQSHTAGPEEVAIVPATPVLKLAPGAGTSLGNLQNAGNNIVKLGTENASELANVDWSAGDTAEVASNVEALEEANRAFQEKRSESKAATSNLAQATGACISTRNKVVAALRMAAKDNPDVLRDITVGLKGTTRNVQKLQLWLSSILTLVTANRAFLKTRLGSDPVELVTSYKSHLDAAVAGHQTSQGGTRIAKAGVIEARNALVASINQMWLAARVAFEGDKVVLQQFRKTSRRLSPRKPAKVTTKVAAQPASSPVAAPPAASAAAPPASPPVASADAKPAAPAEKAS